MAFPPGPEPAPGWSRGGGASEFQGHGPADLHTRGSIVAEERAGTGFICLGTLRKRQSYRTVRIFSVEVTVELRSRVLGRHVSGLVLRLTVGLRCVLGPTCLTDAFFSDTFVKKEVWIGQGACPTS